MDELNNENNPTNKKEAFKKEFLERYKPFEADDDRKKEALCFLVWLSMKNPDDFKTFYNSFLGDMQEGFMN